MILKTKEGDYVNLADVVAISVQDEWKYKDKETKEKDPFFSGYIWMRDSSLSFRICEDKNREVVQKAVDNLMLRLCEASDQQLIDMVEYV